MKHITRFSVILFACFMLFISSCEEQEIQLKQPEPNFRIEVTSDSERAVISDWLNEGVNTLPAEYNLKNLKRLTDQESGHSIFAVVSSENPSKAINFALNSEGKIASIFKSISVKINNEEISNEIMVLENNVQFKYIDNLRTNLRTFSDFKNDQSGRIAKTEGWWDRTEDCVGKFHNLSKSNVANVATIFVFDLVTVGLYSGLSIGFCATAAALSSNSNSIRPSVRLDLR